MALIERYRDLYAHEKDCNAKMLGMMESVPEHARSDERFVRALRLAAHLAAGRENWLDRVAADGRHQGEWMPATVELQSLRPRFAALEQAWTYYLDSLTDTDLDTDFSFSVKDGRTVSFRRGILIEQLAGHGAYHRGQIVLLVDQLGGETVDTDYVQWVLGH